MTPAMSWALPASPHSALNPFLTPQSQQQGTLQLPQSAWALQALPADLSSLPHLLGSVSRIRSPFSELLPLPGNPPLIFHLGSTGT